MKKCPQARKKKTYLKWWGTQMLPAETLGSAVFWIPVWETQWPGFEWRFFAECLYSQSHQRAAEVCHRPFLGKRGGGAVLTLQKTLF